MMKILSKNKITTFGDNEQSASSQFSWCLYKKTCRQRFLLLPNILKRNYDVSTV